MPLRRSARVCGTALSEAGRASMRWASGLTVVGTGMTRVICAVPSGAMTLEFVCGPAGEGVLVWAHMGVTRDSRHAPDSKNPAFAQSVLNCKEQPPSGA